MELVGEMLRMFEQVDKTRRDSLLVFLPDVKQIVIWIFALSKSA